MEAHHNKLEAWIDDNWNIITFLADLEEKGVDFMEFIDVVSLIRKSHEVGVDIDTLTMYIIQRGSAQSAEAERSDKAA